MRGLARLARDVAKHMTIDAQAAAKQQVTLDPRGGADQGIDGVFRVALEHERHPIRCTWQPNLSQVRQKDAGPPQTLVPIFKASRRYVANRPFLSGQTSSSCI